MWTCYSPGYRLPDGTALDLLDAVKARGHEVPVVLMTGSGDADVAVRLLKPAPPTIS